MGYTYRNNGQITDYWPDDTDTTMYVAFYSTLDELLEKAKQKWPEATFSHIEVRAEHIHTDCLGFDSYDSSDYQDFIVLTYRKP